MNLKSIITNLDLANGQLDVAGNQIAYAARAALINSAHAILMQRKVDISDDNVHTVVDESTFEQHARFVSLCAVNSALDVVFTLRPMSETIKFVLRVDDSQVPDYKGMVERDHINGRIFIRDKTHMKELIAARREQDIARRAEMASMVASIDELIENSVKAVAMGEYTFVDPNTGESEVLGYDESLIEDVTDATADKVVRACIDAKDRVQRDLDRCFVPERYTRLTETLNGIEQILKHLGVTEDSLRKVRQARLSHLNDLLSAPEEKPAKRLRTVKKAEAQAA